MANDDAYINAFLSTLEVTSAELDEGLAFGTHDWDSMAHMELIAALEDTFDIMLEPDDITHFGSFANGKRILERYGVIFEPDEAEN